MRNHIIELMDKGMTLEQVHIEVEKMFNEEYKKREIDQERARRRAEMLAALDRASVAVVDFMNGYVGEEVITVDECKDALKETAFKVRMAMNMEKAAPQSVNEDEQKLMDFLAGMGLIQIK